MSSINWPEVLAMLVGFGAFFIYLMNRLDAFRRELSDKIDTSNKALTEKIDGLEKDVNRVFSKVSNIEGQITQMTRPNIIPIERHQERRHEDDDMKEN